MYKLLMLSLLVLIGCGPQPGIISPAIPPDLHIHVLVVMPPVESVPITEVPQERAAADDPNFMKRVELMQRLSLSGNDVWIDGNTSRTLRDADYVAAMEALLSKNGKRAVNLLSNEDILIEP